ncbi:uncharacterized protein LOC142358513 isoform X2 [Convolutriloba macropyga]|uniref:uncharacterized protein LOC142358513 isoform X2 n=1 Tax=Convolutriloba macropyga TaxID=536237 RepID=UPI003F51B1F2
MAALIMPQRLKINNIVICRDLGCYLPILPITCAFGLALLSAYLGAVQRQNLAFHEYIFQDKVKLVKEQRFILISKLFGISAISCFCLVIISKCYQRCISTTKFNSINVAAIFKQLTNIEEKWLFNYFNGFTKENSVQNSDKLDSKTEHTKSEKCRKKVKTPKSPRTHRKNIESPIAIKTNAGNQIEDAATSRMQTARPPREEMEQTMIRTNVTNLSQEGEQEIESEHVKTALNYITEDNDKTCNSISSLTEVSEPNLTLGFDDSGIGMLTRESFSGMATPQLSKLVPLQRSWVEAQKVGEQNLTTDEGMLRHEDDDDDDDVWDITKCVNRHHRFVFEHGVGGLNRASSIDMTSQSVVTSANEVLRGDDDVSGHESEDGTVDLNVSYTEKIENEELKAKTKLAIRALKFGSNTCADVGANLRHLKMRQERVTHKLNDILMQIEQTDV